MLDCHACISRCLRAIVQELHPTLSHVRRRTAGYAAGQLWQSPRGRSYATTADHDPFETPPVANKLSRRPLKYQPQNKYKPGNRKPSESFQANAIRAAGKTPWKQSEQYKKQNKKAVAEIRRAPGEQDGSVSVIIRKELEWLQDPAKLADRVRDMLRNGDERKAKDLVIAASRRMQCTVSWNHLIDYLMSKQKVNEATKTYNDMKKRAQIPDSHTYLLLLRGLANNAHVEQAIGKALSIYHSMSAPNSKVPPSIIHTNAVLKVCARANDMDALWGIASKIQESGPGAADARTFTTILNAIRQNTILDRPKEETEEQTARRREQSIVEGRRMWEDVIGKWRKADLFIDEDLVCAMGRLLLIGSRPRDWDDVLSLVEQTMDIPRLVPRLGSKPGEGSHIPRIRAPYTPEDMKNDDDIEPDEPQRGDEFLPITATMKSVGRSRKDADDASAALVYAVPAQNTLSLILEACLKRIAKQAASDYWNLLTDPASRNIVPDSDNLHMYLRVLRHARASGEAVEILRSHFSGGPAGVRPLPKTFRIVMSTCVRNKNGPDVLAHAEQVLDFMAKSLEAPDVKTLAMYAELALDGPNTLAVVRALGRLGPGVVNLKRIVDGGAGEGTGRAVSEEDRKDALEIMKRLIGCYDRLLNSGEAPEKMRGMYENEKRKLSAFVSRMKNGVKGNDWVDEEGQSPVWVQKMMKRKRNKESKIGKRERWEVAKGKRPLKIRFFDNDPRVSRSSLE